MKMVITLHTYQLVLPCLLGVEGLVAEELRDMGAENVAPENGRVLCAGSPEMIARANIRSRFAERVLVLLGTFEAKSFESLFRGVKALPWTEWIGRDDAFPVKGRCLSSQLMSVPDCQAIIKKAVVESLKEAYKLEHFPETGANYQIQFLIMKDKVSIMLDTSGAGLHKLCREQSTIPVITGGIGVCHIFVDETAEIAPALKIIVNAKTQRPSTCNTVETLLVHRNIADTFLPALSKQMAESGVTLHAAPSALPALQNGPAKVEPVKAEQYDDEYLSLDLNVKVVADMDEAIAHIREHGTQHSDAILTRTLRNANRFINEVDSSAVYVNASTRFTDGGQFGLGAEVAVSTQKLHARGPMGLEALTTYKWIGFGDDTIRA